jgi:hypothetical protein
MIETFNSAEQLLTNDAQDSDSSPEVLSPKDIERMFVWPPNKEDDRRRKRE